MMRKKEEGAKKTRRPRGGRGKGERPNSVSAEILEARERQVFKDRKIKRRGAASGEKESKRPQGR